MMGFFSKLFASTNAAHETAADEAEAAREAQIKKIEALLDSVNSASQHVRNYYITFLLACFYIAMIVWSTTDLMLLKNTPVTMPLLNVNLPITGFYTFAPYFFLLLHFNLLLQFSLLADKTHRFDQAVTGLQDEDSRRYYYTRLFAFAFTQILSARHHSKLLRFLLTLMVWITAIWLPLGILIGLQVGLLPYHDEDILFWQRVAVTLDLFVLLIFWPVIRAPDSRWRSWIKQASGLSRLLRMKAAMQPAPISAEKPINQNSGYPVLEGSVNLMTGFCVIVFVWGIAVLPDSIHEKNVRDWLKAHAWSDAWQSLCSSRETREPYFIATEWLFDGRYESKQIQETEEEIEKRQCEQRTKAGMLHRNLVLREQLLIDNELKAEDEADLKSSDETIRQAALKKITPLILSGRDLRYADFSKAHLPKVDFFGANGKPSDLRYANFGRAMLVSAQMRKIKLRGANLLKVQLQRASLRDAQLQRVDLAGANLQGADLEYAELQGAILASANLQGADLRGANLQGADLEDADLQGADLTASFQGAKLINANLQGADLRGADLQGADLGDADLQGADLGDADLQGADLEGAKLQGANLLMADFSYTDITRTQFGWLRQSALEILRVTLTRSIQDEKLRKNIIDNLTERTEEQIGIFAAQGDNVWDGSYRNWFYSALNGLEFNGSKSDYQNKLAGYLIALACQDRWAAAGIIENRLLRRGTFKKNIAPADSIAQCLLSLNARRNQAGQLICPALFEEVDQATLSLLRIAVYIRDRDAIITTTFSCPTELAVVDKAMIFFR